MEVVLDRNAFLKGMPMVQNIVESRQTLPILAHAARDRDGRQDVFEAIAPSTNSDKIDARELNEAESRRDAAPAPCGARGAVNTG